MTANLTPRERQIVELTAEGLSAKEIGHELSLAKRTVEHCRGSAIARLGARNIAHAVALFVRGAM